MKIVEYNDIYLEDIRDLLVELEEYIISIDKDHLDKLDKDYREKMALVDLAEVKKHEGKCYLAIIDNEVVGVVMGVVGTYDEYDYLDYKCPRRGVITELVVAKSARGKGIGKSLMDKMEEYFKSINCEYIMLEVFAYNENAIKFYDNIGYHARGIFNIKKIK